jgi:hypothetical protein
MAAIDWDARVMPQACRLEHANTAQGIGIHLQNVQGGFARERGVVLPPEAMRSCPKPAGFHMPACHGALAAVPALQGASWREYIVILLAEAWITPMRASTAHGWGPHWGCREAAQPTASKLEGLRESHGEAGRLLFLPL